MAITGSLAERLVEARHRLFVGRAGEIGFFEGLLASPTLPVCMLHISGAGGVGKTALMHELVRSCRQKNIASARVDARNIEPSPDSFCAALNAALGLEAGAPFSTAWSKSSERFVLFIDTYELLAPLDNWLRESFLPEIPDNCLVVLAGRHALSPAWKSDAGWQSLVRSVSLGNLASAESRAYLQKREIPVEQWDALLEWTRGFPLALSLGADLLLQRRAENGALAGVSFSPSQLQEGGEPELVKVLLERLVQEVPGPRHRAALEICSVVRLTSEPLLEALLDGVNKTESTTEFPQSEPVPGDELRVEQQRPVTSLDDAHSLFNWLRSLSFVETGPHGVFPHDMARSVLEADLRWRNSPRYEELHRRARAYYGSRLHQAGSREQQRLLFDYIFLQRNNEVLQPFLDWQETGTLAPDIARRDEWPLLLDAIRHHEGEQSAQIAEHWFELQPNNLVVLRDAESQVAGFVLMLALHDTSPQQRAADPAAIQSWKHAQESAPPRDGEAVTLFRYWMALDSYQEVSLAQSALSVAIVRHCLVAPKLSWSFLPCADANFWLPVFEYLAIARAPEADFSTDSCCFGMYAHDWRALHPMEWLDRLAGERGALGVGAGPQEDISQESSGHADSATGASSGKSDAPLSRDEFLAALQKALRDIDRPASLYDNMLLRSHLVQARVGATASPLDRVAALQALLGEACEALRNSPRDAKSYRALYHTYLQPEASQEQAALVMDLPFSTYRRHLKSGVHAIFELLWQTESSRPEAH